jgi:hypothetical protein
MPGARSARSEKRADARRPARPEGKQPPHEARPIEERYGEVPVEQLALDRSEMITGDADTQLAEHGPDGDGVISSAGAEAEGLTFTEEREVPAEDAEDQEAEPE